MQAKKMDRFNLYANKIFRAYPLLLNAGCRLGAAYNISKLDQRPHTFGEKVLATMFPGWYISFKLAKIAPEKNIGNSWLHTIGKIILPWQYSAFQLAKLKSPNTGTGEKIIAILGAPYYSLYGSTILAERNTRGTPLTRSIPSFSPQLYYPQPTIAAYYQPPIRL